jgi:hypothetical protein
MGYAIAMDDEPTKPAKPPAPPSDREARLAAALRVNLKRRKAPKPAGTAAESG